MDNRDKMMLAGLKKILSEATFSIQRREALVLDQICKWVEIELPKKLEPIKAPAKKAKKAKK